MTAEAGDAIPDGATTYLGSSQSEAIVRVYDKAAESGHANAGVRWELQARADRAARFVDGAVHASNGLASYILAAIRGLIDFRERTVNGRADRAALLPWWAAIIGDADRVGLNGPTKVDSLEQRAAWVERQVAPSLAMLVSAYGTDWLRWVLEMGEERLTEHQRRLASGQRAGA
jgi:phage replication initiation protein